MINSAGGLTIGSLRKPPVLFVFLTMVAVICCAAVVFVMLGEEYTLGVTMEEGTDDGVDGVVIRIGSEDSANERLRKLLLPAVREPDCWNTMPHTKDTDPILPVPVVVAEMEVPMVRLMVHHICHIETKMAKTVGYLILFVRLSREIPVVVYC